MLFSRFVIKNLKNHGTTTGFFFLKKKKRKKRYQELVEQLQKRISMNKTWSNKVQKSRRLFSNRSISLSAHYFSKVTLFSCHVTTSSISTSKLSFSPSFPSGKVMSRNEVEGALFRYSSQVAPSEDIEILTKKKKGIDLKPILKNWWKIKKKIQRNKNNNNHKMTRDIKKWMGKGRWLKKNCNNFWMCPTCVIEVSRGIIKWQRKGNPMLCLLS